MRKAITARYLGSIVLATHVWAQGLAPIPAKDATFEFHSGFWVNLHHFLYEQAVMGAPSPSDPPEWREALDYYRREVTKRDLLTDEAAEINNRLSDLESSPSLKNSGLPPDLSAVLDAAAPIYRERWWAEHDRSNRVWIQAVAPLIAKHGDALRKQLGKIYDTDWPLTPIRTDVAEYANWGGAYTTLEPAHITVSSVNLGNQKEAALEVLFHEASHAMFTKIGSTLSAEVRARNMLFRRKDFWHAVLFYTVGEMVRRQLEDGYTPYALKNGLYERTWEGVPEILDTDWKPYLDGKTDLTSAVRRLVAAYGLSQ
jgi:hypothetical protein